MTTLGAAASHAVIIRPESDSGLALLEGKLDQSGQQCPGRTDMLACVLTHSAAQAKTTTEHEYLGTGGPEGLGHLRHLALYQSADHARGRGLLLLHLPAERRSVQDVSFSWGVKVTSMMSKARNWDHRCLKNQTPPGAVPVRRPCQRARAAAAPPPSRAQVCPETRWDSWAAHNRDKGCLASGRKLQL